MIFIEFKIMKFKFNKIDWLQVGINTGWLKKADVSAEDQELISQISNAPPYSAKQPSDALIRDAYLVLQDAIDRLLHISNQFYQFSDSVRDSEDDVLALTNFLEEDYTHVMQEYPNKPVRFAQEMINVANQALSHLDMLTDAMKRQNLKTSSLINDIRKDLIFGRRILESIT